MKVLDLFSGIGGFSLGLERAGMETVAFCEIEDYPVSKLNKHWPDIPVHRDIRKLDGKQYRDSVDVVCGGFPCQPFSIAGKQRGKEDDRHLWPEMLRIIKEVRPTWVIGENVAGFIRMALDDVLLDLETEGYTAQPFVVPACAVGANHRRDRVWIVAYSESEQNRRIQQQEFQPDIKSKSNGVSGYSEHDGRDAAENGQSDSQGNDRDKEGQNEARQSTRPGCEGCDDANASSIRAQGKQIEAGREKRIADLANNGGFPRSRQEFKPIGLPTEPSVCHRDDGVSDRVARLKALGNAVVPQIPELIGRAIMAADNLKGKR